MFREQVAEHYRQKGYRLHENVKIRGHSGAVHACDLVAQGPLGNLIIAFEDAGGLEGPELGAVKRAAKDVGATAVVAAERPPHGLRQIAARTGVVLLDEEAMRRPEPEAPTTPLEPDPLPEHPPWPGAQEREPSAWPDQRKRASDRRPPSGAVDLDDLVEENLRPRPEPTRKQDLDIWRHDADEPSRRAEPSTQGFGWLPKDAPRAAPSPAPAPEPMRRVPTEKQEAILGLRIVLAALIAGATAGLVFFGLQSL